VTRRLSEFASNGANRSWKVEDDGRTTTVTLWTIALHEPTCRFAKTNSRGGPYQVHDYLPNYGQDNLNWLKVRGVDGPAASDRTVAWTGCKVCGTASIPRAEWGAMVDVMRDEWAEADRRERLEYAAKRAVEDARDARNRYIAEAEADAYDAEFRDTVEARMAVVRAAARAKWEADNAELAMLLGGDHA
jgi:hypothetical protein